MLNFGSARAQTGTEKEAILSRLDNAAAYTLRVLAAMPADQLGYRPIPESRSFAELFQHIGEAQLYTAGEAIGVKRMKYKGGDRDRPALSEFVSASYAHLRATIAALEPEAFGRKISLWGTPATVGHVLHFTLDHVTHHRGQATVYLRLNGIQPPEYIGW